jgi:putative DNA primase/helicase
MKFSAAFLDDIRTRLLPSVVVGRTIKLVKQGHEHFGLCPFHNESTPSFSVNDEKRIVHCFGCNWDGDIFKFVQETQRVDFVEAVQRLAHDAGVDAASPPPIAATKPADADRPRIPPVLPVPSGAHRPPENHFRHGAMTARWAYRDSEGALLGYDVRFDPPTGKQIWPQVYLGQAQGWAWQSFDKPRPLYGLDRLAARPDRPVIIVEGCKATDAAQSLLPSYVAVSWPGGGKAVKHVDWTPLHGRRLLLWPDRDRKVYPEGHKRAGKLLPYAEQPGVETMLEIAEILAPHCPEIKIVDVSEFKIDGFDLADWATFQNVPAQKISKLGIVDDPAIRAQLTADLIAWAKEHVSIWALPKSEPPKTPQPEIPKASPPQADRPTKAPIPPDPPSHDPPPHTQAEIDEARRIYRRQQLPGGADGDASLPPELSDDSLAMRFASAYKDRLRFVGPWQRWMVWHKNVWLDDDKNHAQQMARLLCRRASAEPEKETTAKQVASSRTISAVERLASSDPRLTATIDQWDADHWILNTPGGLVNLRTGTIAVAEPSSYCTRITAVAAAGRCQNFYDFLDQITLNDRDLSAYLQRVIGYCLTGSTKEQEMWFCFGSGGNGKGVFIDIISEMLHNYATSTPIDTFVEKPDATQHPTSIAKLRGARLVTASETEEGRRWAEAKIKEITGGSKISARFMRQDEFEFQPQFKLLISGNNKPGLRSIDAAIRRRMNLIPFNMHLDRDSMDRDLKDKLRLELAGILRWAIDGTLLYLEHGLSPPAAVTSATNEYLEAEDATGLWMDQCCEIGATLVSSVADLFSSWKKWAGSREEFVGSTKRFCAALEKRGFVQKSTDHWRGFTGLAVRVVLDEAADGVPSWWEK